MAFCWRFTILLLLPVILEIGFDVRSYLNEPRVARAVQMLEDGSTQRTVVKWLEVSRGVVVLLWIRFHLTERHRRSPGQGRGAPPKRVRIVSSGAWHVILVGLRLERFRMISSRLQWSVLMIKQGWVNPFEEQKTRPMSRTHCSTPCATVSSGHWAGLLVHHRARLEFALEHQHWQLGHWRTVIFTYKSRFLTLTDV